MEIKPNKILTDKGFEFDSFKSPQGVSLPYQYVGYHYKKKETEVQDTHITFIHNETSNTVTLKMWVSDWDDEEWEPCVTELSLDEETLHGINQFVNYLKYGEEPTPGGE